MEVIRWESGGTMADDVWVRGIIREYYIRRKFRNYIHINILLFCALGSVTAGNTKQTVFIYVRKKTSQDSFPEA